MNKSKINWSKLNKEESGGGVGNNTGPHAGDNKGNKHNKHKGGEDVGDLRMNPGKGKAGNAGQAGNAQGLGGGKSGGMEGSQLAGGFEGEGPKQNP